MKKKMHTAMSLALALALSISTSSAAFTAGRVDTNSKSLYVRPEPTINASPIGALNKGSFVTIAGNEINGYIPILINSNGQLGYVASRYITQLGGVEGTVNTNSQNLLIRKTASNSGQVLTRMPKGSSVIVTGPAVNGYYPVIAGKYSGYAAAQYIALKSNQNADSSVGCTSDSYNTAEYAVMNRLEQMMNGSYMGGTFKVNTRYSGKLAHEQCKGFAKHVFEELFGYNIGSTQAKPSNFKLNISSSKTQRVGSMTKLSSKSNSQLQALFADARPGDVVQLRRAHGGKKTYGYECYRQKRYASNQYLKSHGLDTSRMCQSKSIPSWHIDLMAQMVFRIVWQDRKAAVLLACQMIEECAVQETNNYVSMIDQLNRQRENLKKQQEGLRRMRALEDISREEFLSDNKKLQEEIDALQIQINEQQSSCTSEATTGIDFEKIRATLNQWIDFSCPTISDALIEQFIRQVVVIDDNTFNWILDLTHETVPNQTFCMAPGIDTTLSSHVANPQELLSFTITKNDAAAYCKLIGMKFFAKKWNDKTVIISI